MTTDERFVEACRKAAELRPDKFRFEPVWQVLKYDRLGEQNFCDQYNCTQDDIDRMAEAVGRRILVRFSNPTYPKHQKTPTLKIDVYSLDWDWMQTHDVETSDKLEAHKLGWERIVQQLEKEK